METENLTASTTIDAAPEVVYAIAADPQQLTRWASGLAAGGLRQTADGWVANSTSWCGSDTGSF